MHKDFFYTEFAKLSKFKWDFLNKVEDIEKWQHLAENYEINFINSKTKTNLHKKIPRNIHQIWIGPKKIPKKYKKWSETWKKYNPTWHYKLWTEKDINILSQKNKTLFYSINNIGFRSDILRYEILYKFGGIYIDTDFECIKKIPEDLRKFDFVSSIGFDYSPIILNGFLMASRESNIMKKLLESINVPEFSLDPMSIINSSGPYELTKTFFLNFENNNSLILPSNYCYPYPSFLINSLINKKSEISPESFALHHWEMSWMKGNFLNRVVKKLSIIYKFIKKRYITN